MPVEESERRQPNGDLAMDNVLSTQPELGPSIPDGGYGWVVFLVTLFFQMLIPSLLVSFGIFLVFARLRQDAIIENANPRLWDNNLLHVPLFFMASWTFFDPTSRHLIANSTWPRLVATAGTCLTCAGILFLWLAMTGHASTALFILSGTISGIGASIQISQCEILLAQYFRFRHPLLVHIGHAMAGLGFVIAPIIVGHHILATELLNVVLWYQAIILQGLVLNLAFKKPMYLKSKQTSQYNYISTNPDDEEDIFSKNSRELQIKRQNGQSVNIERHEIAAEANQVQARPIQSKPNQSDLKKQWVSFEDEEVEDVKFERRRKNWEKFEDESTDEEEIADRENVEEIRRENWEQFEDESSSPKTPNGSAVKNTKNLQLEMAFSDDPLQRPMTTTISGLPLPLFSDTPVNNNNTYSYDVLEDRSDNPQPAVFMPTTYVTQTSKRTAFSTLQPLKELTFYKRLITIITTKFSLFTFYALFPSYLYQEIERINLVHLSSLIGVISIAMFLFAGAAYWINVDKKRRPICLWMLCWIGALGYFLISDRYSQSVLLFGAVQVVLSIAALQHVGSPLLGLTIRGEATKEYGLISVMTGIAFLFFVTIDGSFKNCFRLMALLNFFTGSLWLSNFIYKKLRVK